MYSDKSCSDQTVKCGSPASITSEEMSPVKYHQYLLPDQPPENPEQSWRINSHCQGRCTLPQSARVTLVKGMWSRSRCRSRRGGCSRSGQSSVRTAGDKCLLLPLQDLWNTAPMSPATHALFLNKSSFSRQERKNITAPPPKKNNNTWCPHPHPTSNLHSQSATKVFSRAVP